MREKTLGPDILTLHSSGKYTHVGYLSGYRWICSSRAPILVFTGEAGFSSASQRPPARPLARRLADLPWQPGEDISHDRLPVLTPHGMCMCHELF